MEQLEPASLGDFLARNPRALVVDVREPWEHGLARLPGARLIPLATLPLKAESDLPDRSQPLVMYCHHGMRSLRACELLERRGYTAVYNLAGGIARYSRDVDPSVPQY